MNPPTDEQRYRLAQLGWRGKTPVSFEDAARIIRNLKPPLRPYVRITDRNPLPDQTARLDDPAKPFWSQINAKRRRP